MRRVIEVFTVALRLGLTSFGGPIAHLGYFRTEYVQRRRWLGEADYAELVALAQFLPGPSSSQVGAAVGYARAGAPGAAAAWLGFTLPSAVALAGFAALSRSIDVASAPWLHALKLVAVAVVLDAVIGMARTLANTTRTASLAAGVALAVLLLPVAAWTQVVCLVAAAGAGVLLLRDRRPVESAAPVRVPRAVGATLLGLAAVLFLLAPLLARGPLGSVVAAAYRSGALVFGGGHVVLPLLQSQVVPDPVPQADFLAGYGATQAVPGPLFTFASYLGEVVAGPVGAIAATLAIFAPGLLLLFGTLPFWSAVRAKPVVRAALTGVNAGVVGLLAAALLTPIATSSLTSPLDVVYAAVLFAAVRFGRRPAWQVVLLAVAASPLLALAR